MARARNKRGEGGLLRQPIVEAAGRILDGTGDPGSVTLRAVAREADIAAPSIYAHFSGPDDILLALVAQEFDALSAHLRSEVEAVAAGASVERLLAFCRGYLQYAAEHPQRYLVMFGGVWNAAPAIAEASIERDDVAALGQPLLAHLGELLRSCVDAGHSTSEEPEVDAVGLWLGLHGLAHQRIVSTAMTWPVDLEERLLHRLSYL